MKLIFFGYGYSARRLAATLQASPLRDRMDHKTADQTKSHKENHKDEQQPEIIGTHRDLSGKIADDGVSLRIFSRGNPLSLQDLEGVTHIVVSVPPDDNGDPVFDEHKDHLINAQKLRWLGYLSTTGVYGNREGSWVDEASPCLPTSQRGAKRYAAENCWLGLAHHHAVPVHIFRLPGIYGPGRNAFESLRNGRAQRVIKPGHVFSRIHVADIAEGLRASMHNPHPGAVYNLCDNEPAPPQNVIAWASRLLGMPPPPEVTIDQARLSTMAASFYRDNKRVRNLRMRNELGFSPTYGTYRAGLKAILMEEEKEKTHSSD